MYELITDVQRYPEFVPWCTHAHVETKTDREIIATLGVRRGPLHAEFTTRSELEPQKRVSMRLIRGPFRVLEGQWLLTPIDDVGTRIELTLRFAFANRFSAMLFEPAFEDTAASLVDAFVARARALS